MSVPMPRLASLARTTVAVLIGLTALWTLTTAAEARPADAGPQATSTAPAYQVVSGDDNAAPDAQQVEQVLADIRAERPDGGAYAATDVDAEAVITLVIAAAAMLAAGAIAVAVRRTRTLRA